MTLHLRQDRCLRREGWEAFRFSHQEVEPVGRFFEPFRRERVQMAVVADAYGVVRGVVTLEDLRRVILSRGGCARRHSWGFLHHRRGDMAPLDDVHYFRWQSVIDIMLVAFLLYQLYLWVRESRAVRVMVGLAVLGALSLTAAGWLFESLWSMMLLVIVIVFQPEIRRILERMNPLDVFRGQRVVLERETLAELTDAVFSLARKGTLSPFFQPGRLQQDLEREFQDSLLGEALQGGGWTWMTRHWWAKSLAVGLTAVLWTAVVGQQSSEIALTVPIEYQLHGADDRAAGRRPTGGEYPAPWLPARLGSPPFSPGPSAHQPRAGAGGH